MVIYNNIQFNVAGDFSVKPNHTLGPREIKDYELVLFPAQSDTVYTVFPDKRYRLDQPCVLITPPNQQHCYHFDQKNPTRHLFIHFNILNEQLFANYSILQHNLDNHVLHIPEVTLIPTLFHKIFFCIDKKPARWQFMIEVLFINMLEELESHISEASNTSDTKALPIQIHNTLQYIEEHLEEPLEIASLVMASGWSHEHFTRSFKRHIGHTPKEWINKRKIERASQFLLTGSDTVKQVAHKLGFQDEYYFHRLFRKWMGMTATEYRKKNADPRLKDLAPADKGLVQFYPLNQHLNPK